MVRQRIVCCLCSRKVGWFVRELNFVFIAGELAILNDPLTTNNTDHILQHFRSTFQLPFSILGLLL